MSGPPFPTYSAEDVVRCHDRDECSAAFRDAMAGLVADAHIDAKIGEVLPGRFASRRSADETTLYKSLGHIVQDLAAANFGHWRATGRPLAGGAP